MPSYIIWDGTSDIYFSVPDRITGKMYLTAAEFIESRPWVALPNAKVMLNGGTINGAIVEDYYKRVSFYKARGAKITDGMTEREILDAMEAYDISQTVQVAENESKQILNILLGVS